MATSGVYGGFSYRVNQLIEDAALDAGIASQLLTADLLIRAMRALNLMFNSMPNLRIYTWSQRFILLPVYESTGRVVAPVGTFNLLNRSLRTPVRLTGTATSSAGGVVGNATDDDFETVLTQIAPNGNIQMAFTSTTQLYEIGILWGSTTTVIGQVERSNDGVTWIAVDSPQTIAAVDRQWWWFEPDGAIPSLFYRFRITNGATLSAREVYFGGPYNDIPLGVLSRDQFVNLPNSATPGRPLQAWLNRERDVPVLELFQPPNRQNRYCHIAATQQLMFADVTSLRETMDVPARWYDTIKANLAIRICRTFPEADKKRLDMLREQLTETSMPAISEDRDGAPIISYPNIRGYT